MNEISCFLSSKMLNAALRNCPIALWKCLIQHVEMGSTKCGFELDGECWVSSNHIELPLGLFLDPSLSLLVLGSGSDWSPVYGQTSELCLSQ